VSGSGADLVITGCTVLVHDDQERIGFEENATIVVRDGVIESVTTEPTDVEAREGIDARGQVAMPGLINCHTPAPMVTLRGVAEDLATDERFNDFVWPIESNLTEKDVELGARLACARDDPRRRHDLRRPLLLHGRRRGRCGRNRDPGAPRRGRLLLPGRAGAVLGVPGPDAPLWTIDLLVDDNDRDLGIAHRDPTGGWCSC
jgi:hypothetical protein